MNVTDVIFAKELHAHNGEDEDNDAQDERQVTQGPHGFTHDWDEKIERRPRLGQLKHSQLNNENM